MNGVSSQGSRDGKVKVLYVAGWGRSGSTILDNVLGQLDGFFSVGELSYVWDRNVIENRICGCGRPFRECPVWTGVMEAAFGGMDGVDAREMIRLRDRGARTRHVPLMLAPRVGRTVIKGRLDWYPRNLGNLYRAIRDVTGSRVIVDSSKLPSYGYALGLVPEVDLYVVHLVRDPRAVAHSWQRKMVLPDTGTLMTRHGSLQSPLIWDAWNAATEVLLGRPAGRYMRLRYEDFVEKPREAVGRILELVGEEVPKLPFVSEREVELGTTHTVSGNPSRFRTGTVELRADEEWRRSMKTSDERIVSALSWPLRARYGYDGSGARR